MMSPLFTLYVVWHPSFSDGKELAKQLYTHFKPDLFQGFIQDFGINVLELSKPPPGTTTPISVKWDQTDFTVVVALVDKALIQDLKWIAYVKELSEQALNNNMMTRFFPVTIAKDALRIRFKQQALGWNCWKGSKIEKQQRLTSALTHELCRMVRYGLSKQGGKLDVGNYQNLEKIHIFISHSKHDRDGKGEQCANKIRDWIHQNSLLSSFLDVYDIPPGMPFEEVLMQGIESGIVLAIHTDSYSSREWCRKEILAAKKHQVPIVVVDCIKNVDPRGFPYLGNVPIVRMNSVQTERLEMVESCLLKEILYNWNWSYRAAQQMAKSSDVIFTSRPPELLTLALTPNTDPLPSTIVYPGPLLSTDEEQLFRSIVPDIKLVTLADWIKEN